MKRLLSLIFSLFVVVSTQYGQANTVPRLLVETWPQYQVPSTGPLYLDLSLVVPPGSQIYLKDSPALTTGIPTTIQVADQSALTLRKVLGPPGRESSQGPVLQGSAIFALELMPARPLTPGQILTLPVVIKTQLCDTVTGICYPPQDISLTLSVKVEVSNPGPVKYGSAGGINWISSYAEAQRRAQATGKRMFVVITAPTWCGPCQFMESNTFVNPDVVRFINDNFIPVQILDTVNGQRNPDLGVFPFRGYPTWLVAEKTGTEVFKTAGAVDASTLLGRLGPYVGTPAPRPTSPTTPTTPATVSPPSNPNPPQPSPPGTPVNPPVTVSDLPPLDMSGEVLSPAMIASFEAVVMFDAQRALALLTNGTFVLFYPKTGALVTGYPKRVGTDWPAMAGFASRVRAGFNTSDGTQVFVLNNSTIIRFPRGSLERMVGDPISTDRGGYPRLSSFTANLTDAVFYPEANKTFFFLLNGQYLSFNNATKTMDPGFPKVVASPPWGGLATKARNIKGMVNLGGQQTWIYTSQGETLIFDHTRGDFVE